jgi:sugar lactone lactonase YvrE
MKRPFALAIWLVSAAAPMLAQSPATAPAEPYVAPTSTLSSLFGRYTIQGDFAVKDPKEWGGTTTWLAADGKGTVVVMVRVAPYFRFFTTQGALIRQWGDKELFTGEAHSVHFGPDGSVWATDSVDHTVRKFSPTGQLLLTLGKQKVAGDNASQDAFNRPNAVAFGPNGNVFVSDGYANQRVEFTPEGKFVRIFGGKKGRATARWRWFTEWPSTLKDASTPLTATTSACSCSTRRESFSRTSRSPVAAVRSWRVTAPSTSAT